MANPAFLSLRTITCNETEDITGPDDLVGILGNDRFPIGRFNDGDSRDVAIDRTIPQEVTELTILEADAVDPDDVLTTIDLTQDMDVDRVVGIFAGRARYDVSLKVVSGAD